MKADNDENDEKVDTGSRKAHEWLKELEAIYDCAKHKRQDLVLLNGQCEQLTSKHLASWAFLIVRLFIVTLEKLLFSNFFFSERRRGHT